MAIVCEGGVVTKSTKSRKAPRSAAKPTAENARTLAIVKGGAPESKSPAKARNPKSPKPAVVETPAPDAAPETPVPALEASGPVPASLKKPKRTPKSFDAELNAVAKHAESLTGLADAFTGKLVADGKTAGTIASYKAELALAMKHLGETTRVADLTVDQVRAYFESKPVTRLRSGLAKSPLSIDKTRRVLRLALQWAASEGWIKVAPVPDMPAAS